MNEAGELEHRLAREAVAEAVARVQPPQPSEPIECGCETGAMTASIVEDAGAAGSTSEPGAIPFEHHEVDAALLADRANQSWSSSSFFSFAEAPLAFDLHDLLVISDGDDNL